jgi:hypothetical protein
MASEVLVRRAAMIPQVLLALALAAAAGPKDPVGSPPEARALLREYLDKTDAQTERIQALVERLGHQDFQVREAATEALAEMAEAAGPALEQAARSDDPEVRLRARSILDEARKERPDASADLGQAIDVLAEAKDRTLVPTLLQLLGHEREDVRYAAEYGLRRVTGQTFGYNATADAEARTAAAERWADWWKEAKPTFSFDREPPKPKMPVGVLLSSRRLAKVWMVDLQGKVLWSKGLAGQISRAKLLPNGHLLLSRRTRGLIEEYDREWNVVWHTEEGKLSGNVLDLQRLPNGNTLTTHMRRNQVFEIDRQGRTVWSRSVERMPIAAWRLPSGNTLVAALYGPRHVRGQARGHVAELTRGGRAVWGRQGLKMPTDISPLPGGRVLVAEQGAARVIELDGNGEIVWERKCEGGPNSARRLPDGTTVINDSAAGTLLVDEDGDVIRTLDETPQTGKISLVAAGTPLPQDEKEGAEADEAEAGE